MINPDEPDTQRILSDLKQRTRVIEGFVQQTAQLMAELRSESVWVKVGAAREMANFGALYESVQKSNPIVFEVREMPPRLRELAERAGKEFGFMPNGCLLNYYSDGLNTIGFHSDALTEIDQGTGVIILSLGAERTLTFQYKHDKRILLEFELKDGSLLYMSREVQFHWKHAVLAAPNVREPRMSLTFRKKPALHEG